MRTHTKSAVLMTLLLALPTAGCAQTTSNETLPDTSVVEAAQNTESVRPGINDGFTNSDVDAAMWAERWTGESNETYALRHEILAALNLDPGDSVADIGAGTGLFVKLFAETVGDDGKVFAVDISQPFLDFIAENAAAEWTLCLAKTEHLICQTRRRTSFSIQMSTITLNIPKT